MTLDDGEPADSAGPIAPGTARVHGPDAVARLVWSFSPDALAEAYLRGDLDIDGDVGVAIAAGQER